MNFSDLLRRLRLNSFLRQEDVAEAIGVSLRTYKNYELGNTLPRDHRVYESLANFYHLDVNELIRHEDGFYIDLQEENHLSGMEQAERVMVQFSALFAGGELTDSEKHIVMQQIQTIYQETKDQQQKNTDLSPVKK